MQSRTNRRFARAAAGLISALTLGVSASADTLYYSHIFYPEITDGFIERVDLNKPIGTPPDVLVVTGDGLRGLALDAAAGHMYWADVYGLSIRRSNLDGSNVIDTITQDLEWPRTITLDLAGGKMYYGDQVASFIGRANLDGSGAQSVRSTAFHAGLAIDHVNGKMYWSTSDAGFTRQKEIPFTWKRGGVQEVA